MSNDGPVYSQDQPVNKAVKKITIPVHPQQHLLQQQNVAGGVQMRGQNQHQQTTLPNNRQHSQGNFASSSQVQNNQYQSLPNGHNQNQTQNPHQKNSGQNPAQNHLTLNNSRYNISNMHPNAVRHFPPQNSSVRMNGIGGVPSNINGQNLRGLPGNVGLNLPVNRLIKDNINFKSCILKFLAIFEPAKDLTSKNPAENKSRFRLRWKIRKIEMNKILDATKNYRYYIIHNGKESRKDKLELAMEVAVGKKYNRKENEFSVSLSGNQITSAVNNTFKVELHDSLTGQLLAVKETVVTVLS